jgi:uncharacterized protein YuzE
VIYFIKLSERETEQICNIAGIELENEDDYTEENIQKAIKKIIEKDGMRAG